ncbi:MAG: hypothetical protein IBX45_06585 [Campylobacterales bacterium]|nr:hypothetical protein [Campylobacterales bacterium]
MRRLKILKIYTVFWLFIFFILYSNYASVYTFFMSTVTFNIAVLSSLGIGLLVIFKSAIDLVMLTGTFAVMRYKTGSALTFYLRGLDRLFPENVAHMFSKRAAYDRIYFTHLEVTDVKEWLEGKFVNQKNYITFFVSMCLMIGLLGTFTGLLIALTEMGSIVLSLKGDVNIGEVMKRLNDPISGMSVGFGSSLFGVASAIILSVKGYILDKNQAVFIEDVQDWMNSLVVESVVSSEGGTLSGGTPISGIMDIFVEKISEFSTNIEKSSKSNETILTLLAQSIDGDSKMAKDQMSALENISNGLKELNINQYQGNTSLTDSLQDLSTAMVASNKNLKALLGAQEKQNQLLEEVLQNINSQTKTQ